MPKHHEMTRDQLSGVLLSYIGVAADILEFVTETIKDVEIRCDMTVVYRVITYKLNTLLTRFFIESVDRFLKIIGRFDEEDCEINLNY